MGISYALLSQVALRVGMPPGGFCRLLYGNFIRYSFTFREYRSHTPIEVSRWTV
jgi:hypothetical protein